MSLTLCILIENLSVVCFRVVLDSTISDCCHLLSPESRVYKTPFLQSAFASHVHSNSNASVRCTSYISTISCFIKALIFRFMLTRSTISDTSVQVITAVAIKNSIGMNDSVPCRLTCVPSGMNV